MSKVVVAATQMSCDWNTAATLDRAEQLVRRAAAKGAQVVLLQELFETPYFCIEHDTAYFKLARPLGGNVTIGRFADLARELGIVLPVSWFESAGETYFNSIAVIEVLKGEPKGELKEIRHETSFRGARLQGIRACSGVTLMIP